MIHSVHPLVERDLDEAAEYLAKHASARTVARFFAEYERVVSVIVEHPGIGTLLPRGKRTHPFRVFRYSIVYRLVDGNPRVLLVRHRRRRASHGSGRR
jgi:plasmid stabilization system protein ParE